MTMTAEMTPADEPDQPVLRPPRRAGWWSSRRLPGARTHLTDEVFDRMMEGARSLDTIAAICRYAGIKPERHRDWYERGSRYLDALEHGADLDAFTENDVLYAQYAEAWNEARGEGRMLAVATVRDVMHPDVGKPADRLRAAIWILEHEDPAKFGKRTTLEHTGADGGPIQVGVAARHERLAASVLAKKQAIEAECRELPAGTVGEPGTSGGSSDRAADASETVTPTGPVDGGSPASVSGEAEAIEAARADQTPAEPSPQAVDNPVGIDYDHWAVGLGFPPEYLEAP